MDIKYFDQRIIDAFKDKIKYNSDEREISLAYNEIYRRGLADDPAVIGALHKYQKVLLQDQYDFILELGRDGGKAKEALKPNYNRTLGIALYQYLDLGGIPDEKIGETANAFNINLNEIATSILRNKRDEIDNGDIFDVICGRLGLTQIVEKAIEEVKRTIPLYDDWSKRTQFSTTLYMQANSKREDSDIYSVECDFDDNGNCQNLIVKLEDSDFPLTIDVSKIMHLAFSKNNINEQAVDNGDR